MPIGSTADSIRSVMLAHERKQPDAIILIAPETENVLTYRGLADETRQLASRYSTLGLVAGDHVGFLLHNGYQTTSIFLGTMAAGLVIVPLNLLSVGQQLAYVLRHSLVKLVFTSQQYESQLRGAIDLLPAEVAQSIRIEVIDSDVPHIHASYGRSELATQVNADAPAMLMYTSGTTGQPKGALLTHGCTLRRRSRTGTPSVRETECYRLCRSITSMGNASPRSLRSSVAAASSRHINFQRARGGLGWIATSQRGSILCQRSSPICSMLLT